MAVLRDVWANYRDESFILQFLSPQLMRKFGLFHVMDDASEPSLRVEAIHDERGYRKIKQALARQYDVSWTAPDIQVVDVDLAGDRRLILHHRALNRVLLDEKDTRLVLQHLADLWGYDVSAEGDRSRQRLGAEGARRLAAPRHRPDRNRLATRCQPMAGSSRHRTLRISRLDRNAHPET